MELLTLTSLTLQAPGDKGAEEQDEKEDAKGSKKKGAGNRKATKVSYSTLSFLVLHSFGKKALFVDVDSGYSGK